MAKAHKGREERPTPQVIHSSVQFSSVQSLSRVRLWATPWTAARQASLSITNSRSLFKLMCIESVMPSNHLILCCPLLLPPSIFPRIRVFSNIPTLHVLRKLFCISIKRASLVAQTVKNLPAMQETWVHPLSWEDPLEKGMANHSNKITFKIH